MSLNVYSRLVDYSSDESENNDEEDSSKIDYSKPTSANETKEKTFDNTTKWEALPLPSVIQQMYRDIPDDAGTNPSNHGGKIRSFPHERGVWATYVYIEYNPTLQFLKMVEKLNELVNAHGISMEVSENFHVSLSKTLKLRHHWIVPLMDSLKTNLSCFYRFKIIFQSLEVYENEEKTRTFLGMKVHIGFEHLVKLCKKVDECLSEFKLPCFYKNPSFHLSFASCVGSKAEEIELFLADLDVVFQSFVKLHTDIRTLWATKLCCKSGNKQFTVNLKS